MKYILVLLFSLALFGCSSNDELPDIPADAGEQQIYNDAQRYLRGDNYDLAVRSFQLLEARYPFGNYAEQAQLEIIYAHYSAYEHEAAVEAADRFIRLHPQHPNVDYAYYMKGMNSFHQINDVSRDQSLAYIALKSFNEVISRFPNSEYANDSKERIKIINDRLAGKELNIAMQYQKDHQWVAAINRYNNIINKFGQTRYVPEALHRLVEIYLTIGIFQQAEKYAATLGYNYSDSYWYKASYELINKELKSN